MTHSKIMYIAECDKSLTLYVGKITAQLLKRWDDIGGKEGQEMVELQNVEAQLHKVGMRNRFFGKPEVRELCHILTPNETIQHAVLGQYEGGFALMVATDRRVLLIDKKPWFLTMEDIRYDMVSEVDFYARLLDSTVSVITISKTLKFTSWSQSRLRDLVRYIQHRVMELRHIDDQWQQQGQQTPSIGASPPQLAQPVQSDFASSYQAHVKRHSLAHVAGKVATVDFTRPRPIIKPLYPRPSLVTKYRQGGLTAQTSPQMR